MTPLRGLYSHEWTFGIGDVFSWPFGQLKLIDTEGGFGSFVEMRKGSIVDGSPIYQWELCQYVLQGVQISRYERIR